jgi:predicted negative regulator of RcsB-dependent stress response
VDSQTRHALKQDKFVSATQTGLSWIEIHRDRVIPASIAVVVILAVVVVGAIFYQHENTAASVAVGQALEIYNSSLRQPGEPDDGTYKTTTERAQAANKLFVDVANKYGMFEAGKIAKYFAGLTDIDLGKTADAEANLKGVSGSFNKDLSALAKVALANLYVQTGKTQQAIDLYKELIAKPTDTVPAPAAQLQLAAIYEKTDPMQARQIYAVLKDKDKTTAAGQIAAQKLNPGAAAQQGPQLQQQ